MIAAKVAMVGLAVELNLPLSTLDRINKVFKKSLRIQTLLKGQLKMFLFLVLSSSFLCLLFFFSVIRGRHVCSLLAPPKPLYIFALGSRGLMFTPIYRGLGFKRLIYLLTYNCRFLVPVFVWMLYRKLHSWR